jgi:pimeloyl-ACP methyl ester carboxylesterase
MRVALRLLLVVCVVYGAYAALLTSMQEALIFPVPGGIGRDQLDLAAAEQGVDPFDVIADDGTRLYGWYRPAPAGPSGRRAVLYFHGNGETVAGNMPLQRLVSRAGFDFVTVAYRGYPGSDGAPSEEGLRRDARAAWEHVTGALGVAPERVILHGRSLGGAVAIGLAAEVNERAVVLESTFHSMLEMAAPRAPGLPVSLLLRHPFLSWKQAAHVGAPVLQLHSRDDQLIPVEHGRRLSERFAEVRYLETEGFGHDDVLPAVDPAMNAAWLAFVEEMAPR